MYQIVAMLFIVGMVFTLYAMLAQIQRSPNPCGGFAKIVLSDLLNDIRGSIGAHTYSVWKGTHYIREKASSIENPNSAAQVTVRNRLALLAQRWSNTLTAAQHAAWGEIAQKWGTAAKENASKGYRDLMPDLGRNMSGYNAYIAAGVANARIGKAAADNPPLGADIPKPPSGLAVTPDGPPITKLTITWTDEPDMGANDIVGIWLEIVGLAHKQYNTGIGIGVQTYDLTQARGDNGANIGIPIGIYRVQLCTYNDYGFRSFGSELVEYNKTT